MDFNLLLFEGTDSIKFGMTSEEIQSILKTKPTLFRKSAVDLYETEEYKNICHVYYEMGKNGLLICSEIEFFKPSQVFFDNTQLIGERREKIEALFKSKFNDYTVDDDRSNNFDIGFYAPILPRKNSIVESVAIARKGYSKEQKIYYEKAYSQYNNACNSKEYYCIYCGAVSISETPLVECSKCNVIMVPK